MMSIYKPNGRALEYCERAINLFRGCGHGCRYCYAPGVLRMTRDEFSGYASQRRGILVSILFEAPKHKGHEVLMCFTTDPYNPTAGDTARLAIKILQDAGCVAVILTKGGKRSEADLAILRPGVDKYGATLTFVNEQDSLLWEPNAALPIERIEVLAKAKSLGIKTWASLEPVIDPVQTLELIRATAGIVDIYKIGKWNHDKEAKRIDWRQFCFDAIDQCEKQGSEYRLKRDLAVFI